MNLYLLGLGSNINPQQNMFAAQNKLNAIGEVFATSPILMTAPVGDTFHSDFANQLVVIATSLPQPMLKHQLLHCEELLGREPKSPQRKIKDRTIDIDILQQISETEADGLLQDNNVDWSSVNWCIEDSYYCDVLEKWRQH